MSSSATIDPIKVSVIANALDAITKEMGETMLRTSRSPIFSEARDFVTSIFDREARLVAQTHYIPVIGGSTPYAMAAIAERAGDDVAEGDAWILNDPYRGNNHPPDVVIVRPVFHEGEHRFWVMAKGHNADVGGGGVAGYNPRARDAWEDALRIPPVRIMREDELVRDVWDMIMLNTRVNFLVEGDLNCQLGAARLGARRMSEFLTRFDPAVVDAAINQIFDASERQVAEKIVAIPDGVYSGEARIDHDGIDLDVQPTVRLTIRVDGDRIEYDFTDSDDQTKGYLNSSLPNTISSSHLSFFALFGADIRYNDGATRPITVTTRKGSIANPIEPAPTTNCTVSTCEAMTEAAWLALSDAIPEWVDAPWARWCAPATMGINPRTGRPFSDIHFMSKGGGGATQGFDGWDHIGPVICLGGIRSPDPELHELVTPYEVLEYELLPDSAGAGRWRGGLGVRYRWRVLADGIPCANFGSGNRPETAPVGVCGGLRGIQYNMSIRRADGTDEPMDANQFYELNIGDEVLIESSGGGGYGPPEERDPASLEADVRDGVVSEEAARRDYGFDPGAGNGHAGSGAVPVETVGVS
ncbi:MAG: hydantoinase B/oxoprolinase family protein [Acidimicrobiales bacterium]